MLIELYVSIRKSQSKKSKSTSKRSKSTRRSSGYIGKNLRKMYPNFKVEKNVLYPMSSGADSNRFIVITKIEGNKVWYRNDPYKHDVVENKGIFTDWLIRGSLQARDKWTRMQDMFPEDPNMEKFAKQSANMLEGNISNNSRIKNIEDLWTMKVQVTPTKKIEGDPWRLAETYGGVTGVGDDYIIHMDKRHVSDFKKATKGLFIVRSVKEEKFFDKNPF